MFRHNRSLRLTSMDAVPFARVTCTDSPPPVTVGDFNRRPAAAESVLANMAPASSVRW